MMSSLKRPFPPQPDFELYKHLTEKERMLAGFPYRPADEELTKDRLRARTLLQKYNSLNADDKDGRHAVLDELLHPNCHGNNLFIKSVFRVEYGYNFTAGKELYVNVGCVFLDSAPITIGNNCLIAPGVHVYAATHPIDPKYRQDNDDYRELAFPVKIGNDCWIGGNSIICPGVTIGDNVTVGAGSVVTKDVPSNVIVAGNPAKIVRHLKCNN